MSEHLEPNELLDLTGSGVYHAHQLRELAKTGPVIHLGNNLMNIPEMIKTFLEDPKPVCWRGIFQKLEGESNALKRCYPLLLENRQ